MLTIKEKLLTKKKPSSLNSHQLNLVEKRKNYAEWDLLCSCCMATIANAEIIIKPNINWRYLLVLAAKHKVRALLFKGLKKHPNQSLIPKGVITRLKQVNLQIANNNLRQTGELIQLNEIFVKAGVQVVFYKGSVLASEAFKDLKAREYADIDLLVDPKDFSKIQAILEHRNYQAESTIPYSFFEKFSDQYHEYNFDYYENDKRIFHVEPHWTIGAKRYQIAFSLKDFSPFLIKKNIFGRELNTFTSEGMLLSVCLHHGGQDNWSSLKQISDVAAILQQFETAINWPQLIATAQKWRVINLLLLGLGLTQTLLKIKLPHIIEHKLDNSSVQRQVKKNALKLLENKPQSPPLSTILNRMKFHLALRQSPLTKLKIIYYHLLQIILPNDIDVAGKNLTKINYFWLSLSKPFRLFKTYLSFTNHHTHPTSKPQ